MKIRTIILLSVLALAAGLIYASPSLYFYALDDALLEHGGREPSAPIIALDDVMEVDALIQTAQDVLPEMIGGQMDGDTSNPLVAFSMSLIERALSDVAHQGVDRDNIIALFAAHRGLSLGDFVLPDKVTPLTFRKAQWRYDGFGRVRAWFDQLPSGGANTLPVMRTFVFERRYLVGWRLIHIEYETQADVNET